jgi:hypothetical protein
MIIILTSLVKRRAGNIMVVLKRKVVLMRMVFGSGQQIEFLRHYQIPVPMWNILCRKFIRSYASMHYDIEMSEKMSATLEKLLTLLS